MPQCVRRVLAAIMCVEINGSLQGVGPRERLSSRLVRSGPPLRTSSSPGDGRFASAVCAKHAAGLAPHLLLV